MVMGRVPCDNLSQDNWLTYLNADNKNISSQLLGGNVKNASDCASECVDNLGKDPTTGCTSYTYYHADYHEGRLAGKCYGDGSGS